MQINTTTNNFFTHFLEQERKREEEKKGSDETPLVLRSHSQFHPGYHPDYERIILTSDDYPQSWLFPSFHYPSVLKRLKNSHVMWWNVGNENALNKKVVIVVDGFFLGKEGNDMRTFSGGLSFDLKYEDIKKEEERIGNLNFATRQQLYVNPPSPLLPIHKLISTLSEKLKIEITTYPTKILGRRLNGKIEFLTGATNTNKASKISNESVREDLHQDYDPALNLLFKIPLLYPERKIKKIKQKIAKVKEEISQISNAKIKHVMHPKINKKINATALHNRLSSLRKSLEEAESGIAIDQKKYHPYYFENGERGRPLIITLLLYTTEENFKDEYKLGTCFYNSRTKNLEAIGCKHMRFVIFRGDIWHGISASIIPNGVKTSRVSWAFRLVMNPKGPYQDTMTNLTEFFRNNVSQSECLDHSEV